MRVRALQHGQQQVYVGLSSLGHCTAFLYSIALILVKADIPIFDGRF